MIKALSPEDAGQFLLKAGIKNENLRGELVKLTEGYPIFLDLCVDVYVEYKRQNNNNEPTIKDFGSKRQDVVARILRYIIEDKDDAARDMLEFLCMLNVWTDELAFDIGKKALEKFSRNTYKRVKNFSFIQEEQIENEDISLFYLPLSLFIFNLPTAPKKVFGKDDETTLRSMNNLAMILHKLNRDNGAQKIIKRARSLSKKVLSSDDELFMNIEDTYKKVFNA